MVLSFFDSHFWRDQFIKISDYTHFIHKSCHKNFLFPYSNFVVPYLILFSICVGWFIWLTCRLLSCSTKRRRGKRRYLSSSTVLTHCNRNDDYNDEHFCINGFKTYLVILCWWQFLLCNKNPPCYCNKMYVHLLLRIENNAK